MHATAHPAPFPPFQSAGRHLRKSLGTVLLGMALTIAAASPAHARDWLSNLTVSPPTTTGPTTIPIGQTGDWTATATWSFDYDLINGEQITFSALAQSFQEFATGEFPASLSGDTLISCLPTCTGHGSVSVSYTATGAFSPPPGGTLQDIYLQPTATMTSLVDPHTIHIYDLPIRVAYFGITVTEVPEPSITAMLMGSALVLIRSAKRRRRNAA